MSQNPALDWFFRYRLHVMILPVLLVEAALAPWPVGDKHGIALAFGLWAGFVYLLNKAGDATEDAINQAGFPVVPHYHGRLRFIAVWMFVTGAILLSPYQNIFWLYIFISMLGLFYTRPLPGLQIRLKNIPFVKNIVSAAAWAAIPAFVPPLYYDVAIGSYNIISFIFTFFLLFLIEVVWDIRDIKGDIAAGVKTIPVLCGIYLAKLVAAMPLVVYVAGLFLAKIILPLHQLIALALTILVTWRVRENSHPYMYQAIVLIWLVTMAFHWWLYAA